MTSTFAREEFAKWFNAMTGNEKPQKNAKKVFVIVGAPGSGKTTYVKEHRRTGDLVLDLDTLAAALQGSSEPHPDYSPVMNEVLVTREAVYSSIEERAGNWARAFVITSSPDMKSVNKLVGRLGAEVVKMKTTKQSCIDRVKDDTTRQNKEKDVRLIEEWFNLNP